MNVIFLKPAREDMSNAYDWYEAREVGLGKKFVREVTDCVEKLKNGIIEFRKYCFDFQYIRLRRFPFSIFFLQRQ
jgi:hypothetical protein